MALKVLPSDLYFKYPKVIETRFVPKFSGKGDPETFNRDDLYDIVPMLEAVMDELGRDDQPTLHYLEELIIQDMPRFLQSRGEVFDFLVGCTREALERCQELRR